MQDDIARDRGEIDKQQTPEGCITVTKAYLTKLQNKVVELEGLINETKKPKRYISKNHKVSVKRSE